MARLKQITPLVPVTSVPKSAEFFQNVLGFEVGVLQDGYAYLKRDDIAIRLIEAAPDMDMSDPKRQLSCYIDVEDVDTLYAELKPKLDKLPPGRVRAPFNQDYGQREFHVIDLDALLIFFGAAIGTQ